MKPLSLEKKAWIGAWAIAVCWSLVWPYSAYQSGPNYAYSQGPVLLGSVSGQLILWQFVILQVSALTVASAAGFFIEPGLFATKGRISAVAALTSIAVTFFYVKKNTYDFYAFSTEDYFLILADTVFIIVLVGLNDQTLFKATTNTAPSESGRDTTN